MKIFRFTFQLKILLPVFLLATIHCGATPLQSDTLRLDSLKLGWVFVDYWRYHTGDDTAWARPDFDESSWREFGFGNSLFKKDSTLKGFFGPVWFRLHVYVDTDIVDLPLAFKVDVGGACEFYVDGKLVQTLGTLGLHGNTEKSGFSLKEHPVLISWASGSHHVLAVRTTNYAMQKVVRYINFNPGGRSGFFLVTASTGAEKIKELTNTSKLSFFLFFSGVFISLSLFHFLLFVFYRLF